MMSCVRVAWYESFTPLVIFIQPTDAPRITTLNINIQYYFLNRLFDYVEVF